MNGAADAGSTAASPKIGFHAPNRKNCTKKGGALKGKRIVAALPCPLKDDRRCQSFKSARLGDVHDEGAAGLVTGVVTVSSQG
ncbi:hypothetical protein MRX96_036395 [Rhipicephalus microplus]